MQRAVERGLSRRDLNEEITYIGIDEKGYRRGHRYVTVLTDIDTKRVLGLIEGIKKFCFVVNQRYIRRQATRGSKSGLHGYVETLYKCYQRMFKVSRYSPR